MIKEQWKSIPNYEGLYEVSNLGRVKSLSYRRTKQEKILNTAISTNKRICIGLCKNGIQKTHLVHQLVAVAFLNHTPNGHKIVVDHVNDDYLDNRLENLQLITQRENVFKTQGEGTSKYKGVSWSEKSKKWLSYIYLGKNIYLGCFENEYDAHQAYQNKLKTL